MSNIERLRTENETVHLLLNKLQRHRGDTLNSRAYLGLNKSLKLQESADQCVATISAQVTSPQEGIIGVKLVHW